MKKIIKEKLLLKLETEVECDVCAGIFNKNKLIKTYHDGRHEFWYCRNCWNKNASIKEKEDQEKIALDARRIANKMDFEPSFKPNASIESVTLQNVEVQQNGILRNSKGRLIGRLINEVEYSGEHIKGLNASIKPEEKRVCTGVMIKCPDHGNWCNGCWTQCPHCPPKTKKDSSPTEYTDDWEKDFDDKFRPQGIYNDADETQIKSFIKNLLAQKDRDHDRLFKDKCVHEWHLLRAESVDFCGRVYCRKCAIKRLTGVVEDLF